MIRSSARLAILATLTTLHGCGESELNGPPELRAGRDECAECGMIITDERACAAILIDIGGRREHRLFDDLGCLVDFRETPREAWTEVDAFAVDHASGRWITIDQASFLLADTRRLMTPMGSGYIAYADESAANQAIQQFGGRVARFEGLREARHAWRAAIFSDSHQEEHPDDN